MNIDRKQFFDAYRVKFGKLSTIQVKGLSELLGFIEADRFITRIPWAAYMLATTKHETDSTFHPIHEYGGKAYFVKRYGGQTRKGKELGNDTPDEGYYYAGKGYPQTTGESNYEKAEAAIRREYPEVVADFERRTGRRFDLTVGDQPDDQDDPANMMDPAIAYATMSYGMRTGMFTTRKMSDYLNSDPPNYKDARKIINGLDKAALIAGYARTFEAILRDSATDAQRPNPTAHALGIVDASKDAPSPGDIESETTNGTKEVKAEITPEGGVKLSSTEGTPGPKERVAIVKTKPKRWYEGVGTKISGVITGNALVQWIIAQLDAIKEFGLPPSFWWSITIIVAGGSLIWIASEIWQNHQDNKQQKEIDELLVKENSTPDNLVQLIPSNQIELYRLRKFKIITRGESGIPYTPPSTEVTP